MYPLLCAVSTFPEGSGVALEGLRVPGSRAREVRTVPGRWPRVLASVLQAASFIKCAAATKRYCSACSQSTRLTAALQSLVDPG